MIRMRDVSVCLSGRRVIGDVSFDLAPGEFAALTGPNGAGKSTVLKALAGVAALSSGEIRIAERPAAGLRPGERARQVAWLAQARPVAWNLRAEDVAALGRFVDAPQGFDRLGDTDRAAVTVALAKADATHLTGRPFQSLSGGEQARIHLARLLASPARCLLLDEPAASLDIAHQLSLMGTLAAEAASGRAVLVVLHDLDLAARFCPRTLVMDRGRKVSDGPTSEALSEAVLADVFGVRRSVLSDICRI
jgi:iron complex transport system ATP-binding protein